MSKRPATAVVVAAGLVAGCLLGTAPAGAATNVAAGAGQAGTVQFAFSVQDGPNGPSGHAVLRDPVLGEAQGDVICLRRTGSQECSGSRGRVEAAGGGSLGSSSWTFRAATISRPFPPRRPPVAY